MLTETDKIIARMGATICALEQMCRQTGEQLEAAQAAQKAAEDYAASLQRDLDMAEMKLADATAPKE
jgi:soluble lytic murein transglycosylase-like protein